MVEFGVAVINKERGFTSHDVVAVVKRTLGMKAGHTGTLDPMAEGVLPVCVGKATKLAGYLTADDKTYITRVHLGVVTDTGDETGTVLKSRDVVIGEGDGSVTRVQILNAVSSFAGEQIQTPPMYSAVKVNGRKLYELARKGQTVPREPRRIIINHIKVLEFSPEEKSFTMEVSCSKGTYIRVLCEDIGERLGCGACMGSLLRTRSGMFTLENAVKLRDLTASDLLRVEDVLPFPRALAHPEAEKLAANGNPIPAELVSFEEAGDKYWLSCGGTLRGLYRLREDRLVPEVML